MDTKNTVLVACALKKEAQMLQKHLSHSCPIIATGLGADRTARKLEQVFETSTPKVLLFTGMAGQLDPSLELGDFVFPQTWSLESGTEFQVSTELLARLRRRGWVIEGKGLTVRRPVVRKAERLRLFEKSGARICDMESAAAMMVASAFKIPCVAPKIVSDTSDSGMLAFYRHFNRNIEQLADEIEQLLKTLREIFPAEDCPISCPGKSGHKIP